MKNKLIAGIAISAVLIAALVATPAQSRDRNSWVAPLVGGMIVGSIMTESARNRQELSRYQERARYQEQPRYQEQSRYQRHQEPQRPYDLPPTRVQPYHIDAPLYPPSDGQPTYGQKPETYIPVTLCRREWTDDRSHMIERCSKQYMNQRYITCNGSDDADGVCWQQ